MATVIRLDGLPSEVVYPYRRCKGYNMNMQGVYTMKETINYEQEYQQSVYEALCYMYGDNWCDSDDIDERVVFA